ncbi:hypothetical protein [Chitinophaga nivalis]|uniref:Outer membrane protein beta-barrel domain-containing protein n=1 Tax=Chitinophaga nivalis TaxID=2991709 RepID=A0ABT3IU03_9BACT|nr:hypothetical protein [Chitinophaga nivalis]MCW3462857.1 hypothetical protein [Chitinophaga nivalis]MCW3487453.1 hypothetical protein [Chitinophaga nivalis]
MKCKLYLVFLLLLIEGTTTFAQTKSDTTDVTPADSTETTKASFSKFSLIFGSYPRYRKGIYVTHGGDGPLLSFADMKDNGAHVASVPRFTVVFNLGTNFNKDFNRHFGMFTGVNLKNIGLISKPNDSVKLKQRVYTLGIPLGFKIGDLSEGTFIFFAGGEIEMAINYKEKQFVDGRKVHKFNEWFSDRTPLLMPSLFAGFRIKHGIALKVQYYPQNFFNQDYKETVKGATTYPYRNTEANLVLVSLGYNFNGVNYFRVNKKRHYFKMKNGKAEFQVNY